MATAAPRRVRFACPACRKVGFYRAGEPITCKACGTPADPALAATAWKEPAAPAPAAPAPARAAPAAGTPSTQTFASDQEPPMLLAIVALVCGLLSLIGLWATPLSLLLGLAAIATGATALSQNKGDGGVQAMGIIGLVAGSLAVLGILLFAGLFWDDSSRWEWDWDWGWWDAPDPPQNDGPDVDVGIPAPGFVALAAVLGAAAMVLRRGRA